MRTLFAIILLVGIYAGSPLAAGAQQAAAGAPTEVAKTDSVEITTYDNKIVVRGAPVDSRLEIYSVVGIRVKEIRMKQADGEYTVNIARGYYIVRIGETVRKIAIR